MITVANAIQDPNSSICEGEKGKHLRYYGIYQLVIGNTEDGVKVLEEALSSMNTSQEHTILRLLIFQTFTKMIY